MIPKLKWFGYSWAINTVILWTFVGTIPNTYASSAQGSLIWSIETPQKTYYPGEPALLTLQITNKGNENEKIYLGADTIEAFSMEIRDNSNRIVAKGDKIKRAGFTGLMREVFLPIPAGGISRKSIVLNRWCSTLLPPGKYHVICNAEYRLQSEATRIPGTEKGFRAGPLHRTQLDLDIELIKPDASKYKEVLDKLARCELKEQGQSFTDWKQDRDLVREMIAFTEWELAVPYQLNVLKVEPYTWLKRDVINSLARSGTLEAAKGLIQVVSENEDRPERIEDIKREIIDAVYRLRETGKPEIVKVTDDFVSKYKRPVLGKTID